MKTKVTILGESTVEQPKKKIEFFYYFDENGKTMTKSNPSEALEIYLIKKGYSLEGNDLMFAKWKNGNSCLYIGKFNDGVV